MAIYKSYNIVKHKIKNSFEKTQSNLSDINNDIKKLEIQFRSENHNKLITIIPVAINLLVDTPGQQVSVELLDFPDWAINMSQPLAIFNFDTAYNPQDEVESFFQSAGNGTLKDGDISIIRWNTIYWFTKFSEELDSFGNITKSGGYKFTFRFDFNVKVAINVNLPSYSSTDLPVFANINLYIVNDKNYNELQSGK